MRAATRTAPRSRCHAFHQRKAPRGPCRRGTGTSAGSRVRGRRAWAPRPPARRPARVARHRPGVQMASDSASHLADDQEKVLCAFAINSIWVSNRGTRGSDARVASVLVAVGDVAGLPCRALSIPPGRAGLGRALRRPFLSLLCRLCPFLW